MRKATSSPSEMSKFAAALGAYDGDIDDLIPTLVTVLRSMNAAQARRLYNAIKVNMSLPTVVDILLTREGNKD